MKPPAYQTSLMSRKLELREGAILISDAHYSLKKPQLFSLLEDIYTQKIQAPQLIFMGDVFDALFGSIDYTYEENQKMIDLIEKIAQKIEVIYFEGNHDFNLKRVFKTPFIIPIAKQPFLMHFKDKRVYLAHGDFDGKAGYKIYTALIRNPFVLFILKYIDIITAHAILKNVQSHLDKKDDCRELSWFEDFIQKRFAKRFVCDYFIEGHFHQNKTLILDDFIYINLGAFACNQRYFIVKSTQDNKLTVEEKLYKEM
ncbi:MAG: UDP-2,3-diacylglucosamine diphosphatase [Sulfurimonas sp.]